LSAWSDEMSPARRSARIHMVMILAGLGFLTVTARLFSIQVLNHAAYSDAADRQHMSSAVLEAGRGRILDRNGFLLAGNRTVVSFEVYWPQVPEETRDQVDSLVAGLGTYAIVSLPLERRSGNQILAVDVPIEEALSLMGSVPAGTSFRVMQERTYPLGDLMAGIIGRYSTDGCEGLESWLDDDLRGVDGELLVERSAAGRFNLADPEAESTPAVDGVDHILTIDSRFQCIVMEELAAILEESSGDWAAAVVIDPSTGEILAAGSVPVRAESGALTVNHCFQGYVEPGSTFKIVTYSACIEESLLVEDALYDCSAGYISVAGHNIYDSHRMDVLTAEQIIIQSSNVGTVMLSQLLEDSVLCRYCRDFGFGSYTMVGYPAESRGIVPDPGSTSWSSLSSAQIAIGQEVTVTPLHLALAYSVIANGGSLYYPRLVAATWNGTGWEETLPVLRSHPISQATADEVRRTLTRVVEEGTGMSAAVPGVTIAGKTGTAERLSRPEGGYLSAFVGMVPAENPALVVAVVIDGPDYAHRWGSMSAAPAFSAMVSRMLSVEPELALGVRAEAPLMAEVSK
jgi:cell division protein FtsI (penicillin-binding protein 3)